jgi:hypothetical protein
MIKPPLLFTTLIVLFALSACSKQDEPKLNVVKEINIKNDAFIGVWSTNCEYPIFTITKTDVMIDEIKLPFEIKEDKLIDIVGNVFSISSDGLVLTKINSSDPNKSDEYKKCK